MIQSFQNIVPDIDESCYISNSAIVTGKVKIGKNSSVWDCAVLRGDLDEIIIGENTNIQDGSILHLNDGIPLHIGNGVTIGHAVKLHGCAIGDNSLIGIGAIILNGVRIGENSIIGAGAVVTPNTIIPPNSLVLGIPAKVTREVKDLEIEENKKNANSYCSLAIEYKKERITIHT